MRTPCRGPRCTLVGLSLPLRSPAPSFRRGLIHRVVALLLSLIRRLPLGLNPIVHVHHDVRAARPRHKGFARLCLETSARWHNQMATEWAMASPGADSIISGSQQQGKQKGQEHPQPPIAKRYVRSQVHTRMASAQQATIRTDTDATHQGQQEHRQPNKANNNMSNTSGPTITSPVHQGHNKDKTSPEPNKANNTNAETLLSALLARRCSRRPCWDGCALVRFFLTNMHAVVLAGPARLKTDMFLCRLGGLETFMVALLGWR